ncbi:MAG: hypothetical protein V9G11_07330 [Bifidobacterium adolescentis]
MRKLNYCVLTEVNGATSCAPTEAEYPHPVVQVKLGKIKIIKQWSDGASKHADDSVTVQLQRKASGDSNAQLENVGGRNHAERRQQVGQTTVDNLVPGYTYSVVETSGDDRYDVSYTGNNADLTKQMVWSSNADAGTLNATITNTLKTVSLEQRDLGEEESDRYASGRTSDHVRLHVWRRKDNAPLPDQLRSRSAAMHGDGELMIRADHTASFGDITYNAGDATYTYYVTENKRLYRCIALFAGEVQGRGDRREELQRRVDGFRERP